jgi:hypothetical protein
MGDRRHLFQPLKGIHNAFFRHGRARPGHPRCAVPGHPEGFRPSEDVDDRDKPGHDDFGVVVFTRRASAYRCDFKESMV